MSRLTRISQRYAAGRLCHRTVRVARSRVWVRAGVARKEVTLAAYKKPANPSHLDFIDQWGSSWRFATRRASSRASESAIPENDRRRLGPPNCHRTKRHRGAMTATGAELDDGFQLGDAIRWLIFLVPWSAFSLYCLLALSAQLGPLGIVEAVALSLVSLPFWRRVCRRPAYLPYTALLRRHLAKSADSAGFEDTSAAGVTANPGLAWVKTVEERTESMQEELGAFLRSTACRTPEDDFAESDDNAAADDDAWRLDRLSGDGAGTAKERLRRERERERRRGEG